ncbi:transposase [Streptomyces sp. Lzd4kr]|nr:transposase [Streptomyces sp. Lzd4kr]
MSRIADRFTRTEPRRRARSLVVRLLPSLPRKKCWTIAEHAGHATPDSLQHLLARAKWDAEAARDDVREYVVEHPGDTDAVLVVDETGRRAMTCAKAGTSPACPAMSWKARGRTGHPTRDGSSWSVPRVTGRWRGLPRFACWAPLCRARSASSAVAHKPEAALDLLGRTTPPRPPRPGPPGCAPSPTAPSAPGSTTTPTSALQHALGRTGPGRYSKSQLAGTRRAGGPWRRFGHDATVPGPSLPVSASR